MARETVGCTACGVQIEAGSRFCRNCGAPQKAEGDPGPTQIAQPTPPPEATRSAQAGASVEPTVPMPTPPQPGVAQPPPAQAGGPGPPPPRGTHPVSFDLEYSGERNRLTTFFRLILVIPWALWAVLWGIAVAFALIGSWFAMMFTGRYPDSLYGFVTGFLRYTTRVMGFAMLGTDRFPSFGGQPEPDYPVRIDVGPPQARYHRARTFFKLILAFPVWLIVTNAMQPLFLNAAFISWWRIVFTGKQSATMHDALRLGFAYNARTNAFLWLMTELYPRPLDLPPQELPADAPGMPPGPAAAE